MALLTPKDIREHTFQTVRFKEGYDVDEVARAKKIVGFDP